MKPAFEKGTWCFCEFVLQQVQETNEDRITSVSDGNFNLSSSDLTDRCFPLEMSVKRISDTVAYWSKELHGLNHNSLNHPDLNRELIRRWVEMCENRADTDKVRALSEKLGGFVKTVIDRVKGLRTDSIEGINIFRSQL
jgi:hypothetical protein